MKILVLSPKPPWPPHDGGAVATLRCAEGMAANGAEVSLVAMKTEKHDLSGFNSPYNTSFLKYYETVAVDTRIKPLKMAVNLLFSKEPYDLVRFRSAGYIKTISSIIPGGDFDIIQCEGLPFVYYLDTIKKLTSSPVVLRAHNVEHRIREMMALNSHCFISRAYLKNLAGRLSEVETSAIQQFDAVVPISEPDNLWFSSVAKSKPVFMSETGVVTAAYRKEPEDKTLRIGFIGALNWKPNLDGVKWFMTKVWPCLSRQNPCATLHIAGRAAPRNAKKWLRGERVFFMGEIDDSSAFMESMNIIIAPLFAGSGLRIKIIEAMSMGRTVVATPVAVSGLPVKDHHELMIASDPASFCTAVNEVLASHILRTAIGEAAVTLVKEKYDNNARTADLLRFYTDLRHGS